MYKNKFYSNIYIMFYCVTKLMCDGSHTIRYSKCFIFYHSLNAFFFFICSSIFLIIINDILNFLSILYLKKNTIANIYIEINIRLSKYCTICKEKNRGDAFHRRVDICVALYFSECFSAPEHTSLRKEAFS